MNWRRIKIQASFATPLTTIPRVNANYLVNELQAYDANSLVT